MSSLFNLWKTKEPKYSSRFTDILFKRLTQHGGGAEETRAAKGKYFANNYELYTYAFFLGLYNGEFKPISDDEKRVGFSHPIQYWGSKGNIIGRKDFTKIQEYIFMALVAKTDIDFISLEKGKETQENVVDKLIHTMESYTNGGLILINEKFEDNPNYFLQPTAFLDFLTSTQKVEEAQ